MPKPSRKAVRRSRFRCSPHSSTSAQGALNDWYPLGEYHPDLFGGIALGVYSKRRAEAGKRASAKTGGGPQRSWWRPLTRKPTIASSEKRRPIVFVDYVRTVLDPGRTVVIMKPRPDMSDQEATVEAIIEGCTFIRLAQKPCSTSLSPSARRSDRSIRCS